MNLLRMRRDVTRMKVKPLKQIAAAAAIENIDIDAWIQKKVSAEELTHNIKQAQLSRLEELISKL